MTELNRTYIEFLLGEKLVKINFNDTLTPTTTLLQYLRKTYHNKGTKEGCNVGDCGACTVVIAEPVNGKIEYKACNSCLMFLPQIHGKQIITVEHLEKNDKLHPVQQAMVDLDASQCGFCTPGFIMSLFSLYKERDQVSKEDILETFSGNLCRCTGYQSILNAAYSAFKNKVPDHFDQNESAIIKTLTNIDANNGIYTNSEQNYFASANLQDALNFKTENTNALILSGATDVGLKVTKNKELLPNIIDLTFVKELKYCKDAGANIEIGAQATLQEIKLFIEKYYPTFTELLNFFGAKQIRNRSTLAGNIASASPIGDTLPFLMAIKASVELQSLNAKRLVSITDFITGYRQTIADSTELITKIILPKPSSREVVKTYKLSKRLDLDISSVSMAVKLKLAKSKVVENIDVYYGGMSAYTQRANSLCEFLIGKEWSEEEVTQAIKLIDEDFTPISDARADAQGREIMARNLFLKFWTENA